MAAGCFTTTRDRFGGISAAPASPVRFPGLAAEPHRAAPALGEHTREVLAEAGYSDAAIAALIGAGAAIEAG
jgi:formyl-CoA transferase